MSLYPINLNIQYKRCLVIGGGSVAHRKVVTLLEFGADVILVSPLVCAALETLAARSEIKIYQREYQEDDMAGVFLAFAATDNIGLQKKIVKDSVKYGVLLNNATDPCECDFQVPAYFKRGDLQIAISTSGASPAVSRMVKEKLENSFGDEYEYAICLLRLIRQRIVVPGSVSAENKEVLNGLLQDDIISCVERQDWSTLKSILAKNLPGNINVTELLEDFHISCMA